MSANHHFRESHQQSVSLDQPGPSDINAPNREVVMPGKNFNCLFYSLISVLYPAMRWNIEYDPPIQTEGMVQKLRKAAVNWWRTRATSEQQEYLDITLKDESYRVYSNHQGHASTAKELTKERYLSCIEKSTNGEHMGGDLEVFAIAHLLNLNINIHLPNGRLISHGPRNSNSSVGIQYNGVNHYNALVHNPNVVSIFYSFNFFRYKIKINNSIDFIFFNCIRIHQLQV